MNKAWLCPPEVWGEQSSRAVIPGEGAALPKRAEGLGGGGEALEGEAPGNGSHQARVGSGSIIRPWTWARQSQISPQAKINGACWLVFRFG